MWWRLLLSSMLAANVQGFAPALKLLGKLPTQRFVLAPKAQPNMVVVTNTASEHQNLAISDRNDGQSPQAPPHFTANADKTIVWDFTGLCVEARGDQNGDEVGVGKCTGERNQLWEVLPANHIQLKDTNNCLTVAKEEVIPNGVPIKLHQCDGTVTEWAFESEISSRSFSIRHAMNACLIVTGLVTLSVSAWLWRWRTRASDTRQRGAPRSVDQGGVCLIEPAAMSSDSVSITVPSRCAPISMISPSKIVLNPDYGLALGSLALAGATFATRIRLLAVPLGLLGVLFGYRSRVVRFVFDTDAFEVIEVDGDGKAKEDQPENFKVGGANRWDYKTITEWAMYPSPDNPIFVYFRETQTKPEGQGHLFPVLCQPQPLREVMVDRIGEDKRVTTGPQLD